MKRQIAPARSAGERVREPCLCAQVSQSVSDPIAPPEMLRDSETWRVHFKARAPLLPLPVPVPVRWPLPHPRGTWSPATSLSLLLSFSFTFSLFLSLSLSLSLSHTHTHACSLSLACSPSLACSRSFARSLSPSLSLPLFCSLSLLLALSLARSVFLSFTHTRIHTSSPPLSLTSAFERNPLGGPALRAAARRDPPQDRPA